MFFLNPTYLWAFLGLTIPIAIHLWSKREGRTIKIGSVQLLNKADTKQSSSVKLNELWLLILRLALLSVLILIMSQLHIRKKVDNDGLTYIVESSLLQSKEIKSILDTLSTNISIRLLQKGFPEIDLEADYDQVSTIPNYWQLAKEMQTLATDSIIVFTNAYQAGFKGLRPEIANHIEWIPIAIDKTSKQLLAANRLDDQLELLVMNATNQHITFDKELFLSSSGDIRLNTSKDSIFYLENWAVINNREARQVLLFYDDDLFAETKYFEAGFKAVSSYLNLEINLLKTSELASIEDVAFDIVVWFSKKPIINTNARVVLFKPSNFADHLIEESSTKNRYHLTRFLDAENVEKGHLPEQLIQLLGISSAIEKKINQYDRRVLDKAAMIPRYGNPKVDLSSNNSIPMTKWLWGLFILLLVSERIVAKYRHQ